MWPIVRERQPVTGNEEKMQCWVCGGDSADKVYASRIAPTYGAFCKNCLKERAEPIDLILFSMGVKGGPGAFKAFYEIENIKAYVDGAYIEWDEICELYYRCQAQIFDSVEREFGFRPEDNRK
jgi:hypothetical protein